MHLGVFQVSRNTVVDSAYHGYSKETSSIVAASAESEPMGG
jgi:hypothetical protein